MADTAKQFAKYGSFNMRDLGVKERWTDPSKEQGPDTHGITEGRRDAFNSMINLLLNHQQEIVKVPACSTLESAKEWCDARPKSGYRAHLAHLNDDRIPEVVVYDRKGAPFIVNGYKMKGSDYGLRSEYYTANPTKKHRAINSMREWLSDSCWSSKQDPENPYRKVNIKRTAIGDKLKSKGWKIPTKPKAQQSVYSIFCKLVAPYVKTYFGSEQFLKLFRTMSDEKVGALAVKPTLQINPGPANGEFIRRIITPITIYRYLYMKLVLRNYFFQLVDQKIINADYRQFEQFLKEHKNSFFDWFCNNFLDKSSGLNAFSDARISDAIIAYNMSKGDLNTDGSDLNDGLVFLVGVDNWANSVPVMFTDEQNPIHFVDLVVNNEAADYFLTALQNNDKRAKQAMVTIKMCAQESAKQFFKDRLKQRFFIDQDAYDLWKAGHEAGCFTAGSGEAFTEHTSTGGTTSPTKAVRPMVENVSENPVQDDDELPEEA